MSRDSLVHNVVDPRGQRFLGPSPWVVLCPQEPGYAVVQDESRDALGVCRGAHHRDHRSGLIVAKERRPLAADSVHHGERVRGPLLQGVRAGERIRHADAVAIKTNDPPKRAQPPDEARTLTAFHLVLDWDRAADEEHDIEGSLTRDLVGQERPIGRPGEGRLRHRLHVSHPAPRSTSQGILPEMPR